MFVAPSLHIDEVVPGQTQPHLWNKQLKGLTKEKQKEIWATFEMGEMKYLASTQRTVS